MKKPNVNVDLRGAYQELQALDWRNPGIWSQWIYYFFSVVCALAILAGGYYFFYSPRSQALVSARAQERELRQVFVAKQRKVQALGAYEKQLAQMRLTFGSMLKQLPSKSEVASLLNDISQARAASGLSEELFKPQREVKEDFYAEIPNRIVVIGTYRQMGKFVSAVAALPRIVTVNEVAIRPKAPGSADLRMSAIVTTYRYLQPNEKGARAKRKGGHRR